MTNPRSGPGPKGPSRVDILVGARVRIRRKELGLSSPELSKKLGVSQQQVRYYERGTHRISAGLLYELSRALSVPITYFYQDCVPTVARLSRPPPVPDRGRISE